MVDKAVTLSDKPWKCHRTPKTMEPIKQVDPESYIGLAFKLLEYIMYNRSVHTQYTRYTVYRLPMSLCTCSVEFELSPSRRRHCLDLHCCDFCLHKLLDKKKRHTDKKRRKRSISSNVSLNSLGDSSGSFSSEDDGSNDSDGHLSDSSPSTLSSGMRSSSASSTSCSSK